MGERSYLAIGDVLALLREEFPDVTISKIRFLESRGLLVPERTPSGYRKFYEPDVDRLRWILRQQREHFLPLKVIKGRLENGMSDPAAPTPPCSRWATRRPSDSRELVLVGARAVGAPERQIWPRSRSGRRRMPLAAHRRGQPSGHGVPGRGDTPARSDTRGRASRPSGNGETRHAPSTSRAAQPGRRAPRTPQTHRRAADARRRSRPTRPTAPRSAEPLARAIAAGASGATAVAAAAGEAEPPRRQRRHSAPPEPESETEPQTTTAAGPATGEPAGRVPNRRRSRPALAARRARRRGCRAPGVRGKPYAVAELASASGLDVAGIEELESFGLIAGRVVAGVHCYDEEAVHRRQARGRLRAVWHRGAAPSDLQARRRSPDGALRPGRHAAA